MNDQDRLTALHNMACICCESMRVKQPWGTEAHHIVSGGYRKHSGGHLATIPICSWHHRGVCLDNVNGSDMEALYGPSLARNKRQFVIVFGTEAELLKTTNLNLS